MRTKHLWKRTLTIRKPSHRLLSGVDTVKQFMSKATLFPCNSCQLLHLQITNLWANSKPVEEFVLGQKLGRIAAELMGVRLAKQCNT